MNERIKELRRQAIDHCLDKGSQGNLSEEVAEKFAELIVEKCAGIIESQDVDPSFKLRMSWAVKKHFGVK